MSSRKLTPTELENLTLRRVETGAVGRNAIACRCGHIRYFPNGRIQDSVFEVNACIECEDPPAVKVKEEKK